MIGSTLTINLPANAAQETGGNLATIVTNTGTTVTNTGTTVTNTGTTATNTGTTNTDIGPPGATACATDTGSCSVNALLQRIAQRITTALGGTAITVANGADATQGAIADAAYAGSGSATVISALKGIYNATLTGGAVTIADGADVTQGAVADSAYTGSGSASLVAALKGIYNVLAANIYTPGTAGTPSSQVLSVQGITSMTPVQVSQATAASLNATTVYSSQYPVGSTPITVTATGTTAATTATLAANASLKTYICGYSIRANATAAATAEATVTGVVTATMNFLQWTAPLASGIGINEQVFMPCIPSSAINTGIGVVSAAPGSGGTVSVSAWGYQAP